MRQRYPTKRRAGGQFPARPLGRFYPLGPTSVSRAGDGPPTRMLVSAARARAPRPFRSPLRVPARAASFRATSRLTGPLAVRVVGTASNMADEAVADVRFDDGDPAAGLTIEVPLPPPLGVKLLQRPADEPLGKALGRLRATVEKARKGKGSKRPPADAPPPAPPPVPNARLEYPRGDGDGETEIEIIPEDVPNALAWRDGLFLVVDGVGRFRVRVDAPSVATASVAGEAAVGRPLVAVAGGVRFCAEDDLDWRWFRGEGEDAPEIARGRAYVPTEADVGATLVAEARANPPPGDPVACCPPARSASIGPVVTPAPRPHARARAEALGKRDGSSSTVRVMTYNALADAYSHTWGALYPYLDPAHAAAERRLALAMEDVRLADPDVVALQEVDKKWYDAFWVPQMRAAGFEPAGGLAEKTGLTREGCATFARRDKWRVASARVVDLKVPGPLPEERDTEAWVRTQPHLRDALSKVSTVAHVCVLESVLDDDDDDADAEMKNVPGDSTTDAASTGRRRSLVVANTHLFFHPGAVHLRVLQSRWLLRHADRARRARAAESGGADAVGLVVCGDFNGEPHDGVTRHVADGRLSAGDSDWALGSVFRWGGTSSRAAAAELLATDPDPDAEPPAPASDLDARQQRLGRMAASWRCVSEVERGARPSCGRDPDTAEDAAPIEVARAHARCGCTFKTCAAVAAWTLRSDAGMSPGVTLHGLSRARWPGADDGDGGGDDGDGHRGGNGPEWARGDDIVPGDGKLTRDAAEAVAATTRELAEHADGLASLRVAAEAAENAARDELDRLDADADGWLARGFGHAMHLRHPLRLASACGYPEWTNFVSGFRGALDYVFAAEGLRATRSMPMPPVEAVTAQVALPNAEFPSDHLPMVADLEFVE